MKTEGILGIDYDAALRHAAHLFENYPDRFAGTDNARAAAHYIRDAAQAAGAHCDLEPATLYVSVPKSSTLEVLAPNPRALSSVPFANTVTTPADGLTAQLAFVGPGSEDDFRRVDVKGKIILAESSYSPPRAEKIRLATVYGAVGIMIMHWGDSASELMVRGNAKPSWGNPDLGGLGQLPKLPAVGISRKVGLELVEQLATGPVTLRLATESTQFWDDQCLLPIIRIPGNRNPEQIVIVGGHYDSWSGGATDNAIGNGVLLELARTLQARREQLNRSVWITFWPGHETTTMTGSTWFVDRHWDALERGGIVYINIDMLGLLESEQVFILASPELRDFAADRARTLLNEEPKMLPVARAGDQSFFGIGIPSLYGRTGYDEAYLKRTHNATLGWWNHSHPSHDTMDKIDLALVRKAGVVIEQWVHELAGNDLLPADYRRLTKLIAGALRGLAPGAPAELELAGLLSTAEALDGELAAIAGRVDSYDPEDVNRLILRLGRLLIPVTATATGRYGQDPYGLGALGSALPGLHELARQGTGDDNPASGAVLTTLFRERNRLADALHTALAAARELRERRSGAGKGE